MMVRNCKRMVIGLVALLAVGSVFPAHAQEVGEAVDFAGGGSRTWLTDFDEVYPQIPLPNWNKIDAQVFTQLEETDLIQFAHTQALAKPTHDVAQLMERLDIFVRAGDRRQADRIVQAMGHTALARDKRQSGRIAVFLIRHGEWELVQHLLDVCPFATPGDMGGLTVHWVTSIPPLQMDHWLAAHERLYPSFWTDLSLYYYREMGTLRLHSDALAAGIHAHPHDLWRIAPYLTTVRSLEKPPSIAWLPAICHFRLSIENLEMGLQLKSSPEVAIPFLERALQIPIRAADYRWLKKRHYDLPGKAPKSAPDSMHLYIMSCLAKCYKATRQFDKAQALQAEIAAQAPQGLSWDMGLISPMGSAEGSLLFRYIPGTGSDPESDYRTWMTRAGEYVRRQERAQADQAYRKALALLSALSATTDEDRINVMNPYVGLLYDPEHLTPLANWMRSELDNTPMEGDYAHALIQEAVGLIPPESPEFHSLEESFWRYLAARKTWQHEEERVLLAMVSNTKDVNHDSVWTRAEQITKLDPDRERSLGALVLRRGGGRRALPLLQDVARQTRHAADLHAAALLELDLSLQDEDWPHAIALWPEARQGLTETEYTSRFRNLVDFAIRRNAQDEAMELFIDYTRHDYNIFPGPPNRDWTTSLVQELADFGLRTRLRQFYYALALADPESHVPQDSIETLQDPASPER